MTAFTPGPWSLNAFDVTQVIAVSDGPNRAGQAYRDGRHQYAIALAGDIPDLDERMANARLISAAPDLLFALDGLLRLWAEGNPLVTCPEYFAARAALDLTKEPKA